MTNHTSIESLSTKASHWNHFWSARNWRKRKRRVIFSFLQICNFKSIFLFHRLQRPGYFYLILLEYKNLPMEVNFISKKPDWKWARLTKVTRIPVCMLGRNWLLFILYLSNAMNSDLRKLKSIDISFLSRYGFLSRYVWYLWTSTSNLFLS